MRNKFISTVALLGLFSSSTFCAAALDSVDAVKAKLKDVKLAIVSVGKGTSVRFDAGVWRAAAEYMPLLRGDNKNQLILAGNSSGSIPTLFFSCFGISPATIEQFRRHVSGDNKLIADAINELRESEDPMLKASFFVQSLIPALPVENLHPFVAAILGLDTKLTVNRTGTKPYDPRSTNLMKMIHESNCRPQIPFVIVAANQNVLENRKDGKSLGITAKDLANIATGKAEKVDLSNQTLDHKEIDYQTNNVQWTKSAFAVYSDEAAENGGKPTQSFLAQHPGLRLGKDRHIGKACTYFVDPTMAVMLSLIPYNERQCNIRVVETPLDMLRAVVASTAEPTYYDIQPELEPGKVLVGDTWGGFANPASRGVLAEVGETRVTAQSYWGGFIMYSIGQDIRRMLPKVRLFTTGLCRLDPNLEGKMMRALSLINTETVARYNEYWVDFTVRLTKPAITAMRDRTYNSVTEEKAGYEHARACFEDELRGGTMCRMQAKEVVDPFFKSKDKTKETPVFTNIADKAFVYSAAEEEMRSKKAPLPVWRGLGDLVVAP